MRKNFALIFVLIDVLGFSLILPLLPYHAGTLAATPTVVGLLLGANAATQLVGAPIIGRQHRRQFSDAEPGGLAVGALRQPRAAICASATLGL